MPNIDLDEDVWRELQKRAEPLVDTPSDIIRRLLAQADGRMAAEDTGGKVPGRSRLQERRTPDPEFRIPILQALVQLGGRGRAGEVTDIVGEITKPVLKDIDYSRQRSNLIRWRESTSFERLHMSQESPPLVAVPQRGWWEITDAGREYLEQHGSDEERGRGSRSP